nr:unnamed protein product [Callosobruchus chinensis]
MACSTSSAARAGVSFETIRSATGWSHNSRTFSNFYNRALVDNNQFVKMSYKHKSGAQKRKKKAEQEAEVGRYKRITIFFKKHKVDEGDSFTFEDTPSFVDGHGGDLLDTIESGSGVIEGTCVSDSPCKLAISAEAQIDYNDPGSWQFPLNDHVRQEIVRNVNEFEKFVKVTEFFP